MISLGSTKLSRFVPFLFKKIITKICTQNGVILLIVLFRNLLTVDPVSPFEFDDRIGKGMFRHEKFYLYELVNAM